MEKLRTINTTLTLIEKEDKILLGQKKRGFAKGTFNGIGGKQDLGETIEQAMIRETQEEIGVTPTSYKKVGFITFNTWYKGEHVNMDLYIFSCDKYEGEPIETEEIIPQWFDKTSIPYNQMLPDDVKWLPIVLKGNNVEGKVTLNQDLQVISQEFSAVENLNY